MSDQSDEAKARAEAKFKKAEEWSAEGAKAKAEHDARVAAVEANTVRLKALRMAKEAADREVAAVATPAKAKRRKA